MQMKKSIDPTQLLGFRIDAQAAAAAEQGVKLGLKKGNKNMAPTKATQSVKLGLKKGDKAVAPRKI
ncbi:hypothetical protein [Hydrogenophaga sp. 5NK40-0174]|uniref:hypothetical protein n=1 Tax=Hydrogenophaga sp. 5NK40-0174 TaxID=3127649 RepID=UPI00310BBF69